MRPKEISVTKSFTRNLKNYESTRVEYGLTVSLDENDKVSEAREKAAALVEAWVAEDIRAIDEDLGR